MFFGKYLGMVFWLKFFFGWERRLLGIEWLDLKIWAGIDIWSDNYVMSVWWKVLG